MNIKHAQYMITVLQEGSITNAAKKLYVSQPSLSQMIKLVETNLGTPIFNRNTDPITLTYAGQKYIKAAKQILTINNNLQKEIDEINHEDHGKIRLGIPVQRGMQVLPYVLPKFFKLYPHVEVELKEYGSTITENLVLDGSVDLACMTTLPKHDELKYIIVENEELVLLTSKNTNLAKRIKPGTPISITEAKDELFVSNKQGHSVRVIQDNLFIANNIQPKIILETMSIEVEKKVTIACDAVMICPLNYIENTPEMKAVSSTYPILGVESKRHCYICHRQDLYLTKYMKDFINILLEVENPFLQ